MSKSTLVLACSIFLAFIPRAAASEPPKPVGGTTAGTPTNAIPGDVKVIEINDRRMSPFPDLKVSFSVPALQASAVFGERILVRAATDDTGRSLVPEGDSASAFVLGSGRRPEGEKPTPAVFRVSLASPSRSAKALRELSGDVELYVPGRDPAAVATVPNILPASGSPLADPTLRAYGIEIRVISKSAFDEELKGAKEQARQDAKKEGLPDSQVEESVSRVANDFPKVDPRFGPTLKVTDPEKRIAQWALVDGTGREVPILAFEQRGFTILTHSDTESSGPGWGLRVRLFTPGSIVRGTFSVKDLPLP
jgi:hypothetical protein